MTTSDIRRVQRCYRDTYDGHHELNGLFHILKDHCILEMFLCVIGKERVPVDVIEASMVDSVHRSAVMGKLKSTESLNCLRQLLLWYSRVYWYYYRMYYKQLGPGNYKCWSVTDWFLDIYWNTIRSISSSQKLLRLQTIGSGVLKTNNNTLTTPFPPPRQ